MNMIKKFTIIILLLLFLTGCSLKREKQIIQKETEIILAGYAQIFTDTFTETSNTDIISHTSDSGHSWTEIYDKEGDDMASVLASTDILIPKTSDAGAGIFYSADAAPASADYLVEYKCVDCGDTTYDVYGLIRANSDVDAYALWDATGVTSDDTKLSSIVDGSCAQIDTVNEGEINVGLGANNTIITLQASSTEIIGFFDEVGYLYAIDTNITATGEGGIGFGGSACDISGDIDTTSQAIDDFKVYDLADNNTGYQPPSTTGETNNNWSTPTNAYSDDGNYAEEDTIGDAQDYGDFNLTIPAISTIRGIQIIIEGEAGTSGIWVEIGVEVSDDNGSTWSAQKIGRYQASTADIIVFGAANSLWGKSWTASTLDNDHFRVRLTHTNSESTTAGRDLEIDYLAVKVFYDETAAPAEQPYIRQPIFFE